MNNQTISRNSHAAGKLARFALVTVLISIGMPVQAGQCCGAGEESAKVAASGAPELDKQIKLLGHRNWIVVVDSAYPLQISEGIETLYSSKGHYETLEEVAALVATQKHVRANVYLDAEMDYVEEAWAPGIAEYRSYLEDSLKEMAVQKIPHMELIQRLDEVSKLFKVVIVKTDFILPYTSVFFELECGYWDADSENNLRARMAEASEAAAP